MNKGWGNRSSQTVDKLGEIEFVYSLFEFKIVVERMVPSDFFVDFLDVKKVQTENTPTIRTKIFVVR